MRTPVVLVSTLLALAALQGTASAGVAPSVALHSCFVEATNGNAECIVQIDANDAGEFGSSAGVGAYGIADLTCEVSGTHLHIEGGYGFEWVVFGHRADVCRLTIKAIDGQADAYVY